MIVLLNLLKELVKLITKVTALSNTHTVQNDVTPPPNHLLWQWSITKVTALNYPHMPDNVTKMTNIFNVKILLILCFVNVLQFFVFSKLCFSIFCIYYSTENLSFSNMIFYLYFQFWYSLDLKPINFSLYFTFIWLAQIISSHMCTV